MIQREYFDKNGHKIEAGMKLRFGNGDVERVIECGEGDDLDLGI